MVNPYNSRYLGKVTEMRKNTLIPLRYFSNVKDAVVKSLTLTENKKQAHAVKTHSA